MHRGLRTGRPPLSRRARGDTSRWLLAAVLTVSVAISTACTGNTAVSRSRSTLSTGTDSQRRAGAELDQAMQALRDVGSVRFDVRYSAKGHHLRSTTYSAAGRGSQEIRVDDLHGWVRVIGDRTFARGDRATLTGYFGLPDSTAQRVANRWYLLLDGDPGFDEATPSVKLSRLIARVRELLPIEPLHLVQPTVRNGVRVFGIRGGLPDAPPGSESNSTLWVVASGTPVPVEIDLDDYASQVHVEAVFDHWGDPVRVRPPTGAVRLATLPPPTADS